MNLQLSEYQSHQSNSAGEHTHACPAKCRYFDSSATTNEAWVARPSRRSRTSLSLRSRRSKDRRKRNDGARLDRRSRSIAEGALSSSAVDDDDGSASCRGNDRGNGSASRRGNDKGNGSAGCRGNDRGNGSAGCGVNTTYVAASGNGEIVVA